MTVWLDIGRILIAPRFIGGLITFGCAAVLWTAESFSSEAVAVLKQHCLECHSTEKLEGELDLERRLSSAVLAEDATVWQAVLEQVTSKEMPPKDRPALSSAELQTLTAWIESALNKIAIENQGDPGPVVLRRLSNAEYTYTIRDLTGLANIDPAREFPIDGAAGEGFTNVGAGLVMSPALITKYLDAAKEIANHAVLLSHGIRFSEATSERDRTEEILSRIRSLYGTYTDSGGATAVNLQGIQFATNEGGRLPIKLYLEALQQDRSRIADRTLSLSQLATQRRLSPKYVELLWSRLHEPASSLLLQSLQSKWQAGNLSSADIEPWQETLWRFTSVGHIGKVNGPQSWQEPVSPVVSQQEVRLKLSPPNDGGDCVVYLDVSNAMPQTSSPHAVWENLRIVAPEREDVVLHSWFTQSAEPKTIDSSKVDETDLDVTKFGPQPFAPDIAASSLCVEVPSRLRIRLPRLLAEGAELVATGRLISSNDPNEAIQMRILSAEESISHSPTEVARPIPRTPFIANHAQAIQTLELAFNEFRELFPVALCYPKIVPVDEVVTLTLFYREDDHLKRLMLSESEAKVLDQLWDDLRFTSQSPLKQVDAFEQLYQYATQDADPSAFEPLREPIKQAADQFKKLLVDAEPLHLQAVVDLAALAWRRQLSEPEQTSLRSLYGSLRQQSMSHEAAIRMLIARVLVSPAFLYRGETASPQPDAMPVNDWELATRLSYFLWSSSPDAELRSLASSHELHRDHVLQAQVRRMLGDERIRRLSLEFACQWLHIRDIATLDEKSERHFPSFSAVRGAMQEEAVLFFDDLFRNNRSVLSLLNAKHTFVNRELAEHYGFNIDANDWTRIELVDYPERGGVLGFASTLAKQSGASRTSPILRGNWVSEVLLGERLPRPPKGVPVLPEETEQGLTERQMIERHSSDASCASCHRRIDPFGFALEGFDAIGRARTKDAAGLSIDTQATLPDGTVIQGVEGLREYLLQHRREDFVRQFCRKLLGYALGRSVQLSDKPLLDSIYIKLSENDFQVHHAFEQIVLSPQFREIRGSETVALSEPHP
jgi:hypothetical protein